MRAEFHYAIDLHRESLSQGERRFVDQEVIPEMAVRFPRFNMLVDGLDKKRELVFVDMTLGSRQTMYWSFSEDRFSVSVGEVFRTKSNLIFDFALEGRHYFFTNQRAVWYETKKRSTTYGPKDSARRSSLLQSALDETEKYLASIKAL